MGMVIRQFRLMIQIKELIPKLLTAEQIAAELRQNVYPVRKVMAQSVNYSMKQLHGAYHHLLDTDLDIKTGRLEPTLALDLLIARLSRAP
jgi:DNA polymerase-3 subunit delta